MTEIINLANELGFEYIENEPMKAHTTFKIGGNARIMLFPQNVEQICEIVKKCKELGKRYITIGNGSNLLVDDDGIDAVVIVLGKDFSEVKLIDETTIYAEAGASLMKICRLALENGLAGLEFAYGIPGSCGGGAFMNAGAYGGELKDVVYRCDHIDKDGNVGYLEKGSLDFDYRYSAYYKNGCIITGIYLKLQKGDKEEIKAKMEDLIGRRKAKQPLEYPSAGSTFKRPRGNFAGALIEQCGLKGASVGDAQVSVKHAGFVINTGNAKCSDILALCDMVSKKVKEETGFDLEMEIRVTK